MELSMILWMVAAALAAVVIFSFIGFIPGTMKQVYYYQFH